MKNVKMVTDLNSFVMKLAEDNSLEKNDQLEFDLINGKVLIKSNSTEKVIDISPDEVAALSFLSEDAMKIIADREGSIHTSNATLVNTVVTLASILVTIIGWIIDAVTGKKCKEQETTKNYKVKYKYSDGTVYEGEYSETIVQTVC